MLKNKTDRRTLAFIATYHILVLYQWFGEPQHPFLRWTAFGVTCILSWIAAVITHNTLHYPIFMKRSWNRVFQVILTLSYGFPVSEYIPGHNLSHHQYTQTRKDVMRTSKVGFKSNLINLFAFFPVVAADITRTNYKYVAAMKNRSRLWYRQLLIEATACWGSKLLLLAVDWRKCLFLVVLPHAFAVWGITTINYFWHDGCDENSPYNHSRNFVGRIFNWFVFNNGYHGMHHEQPGLHWSLLPQKHAELLHPYIHPNLEQKSFFLYLFKSIFGKRVNYDGTPIQLPPKGKDEDWIRSSPHTEFNFV